MLAKRAIFIIVWALNVGTSASADGLGSCARESDQFIDWGSGCMDTDRGLVWGFTPPKRMSHDDANRFCSSMTPVKKPDGSVTSWGLPSVKDVRALSRFPLLQTHMSFAVQVPYWTSNFESGFAATVIPESGALDIVNPSDLVGTICVARVTGCIEETDRFHSGAGGCIDKSNGIVWGPLQKRGVTHEGAVSFCENSTQFGFTDWKMPSENLGKVMIQSGLLKLLYPSIIDTGGIWLGENGLYWTGDYFAGDYSGQVGPAFACIRETN